MNHDFPARLKFFRSRADLTQGELAKAVGISQKQVSDYEVGSSKPRQATYFKILDALNMTDEEFCAGQISTQGESPLILKIPVYNWASALVINSANPQPDSYMYIDSNILQRTSIDGLFAMQIQGLSMYPHHKDGDFIVIDSNLGNIKDGLLYILSMNDESTIKQCFKQPNGKIHLATFNNDFPSFEVNPDEISVIGQVIFKMGFA